MQIEILILALLGTLAIASITALLAKRFGVGYLIGVFSGAIVIANVIAVKLIEVGPFTVSAAILVFSITFLFTDIISEFWGKEEANKAVWSGFIANMLLFFTVWVALKITPSPFWPGQESFITIFESTGRIIAASMAAYLVSQNHDVWAYHYWKKKLGGKHLWLRNNLSTMISQTFDTAIFVTIAFAGVFPLLPIFIGTVVVKVLIAAADTPFLYAIRWYFRKYRSPNDKIPYSTMTTPSETGGN